jgi:hypothetical protein
VQVQYDPQFFTGFQIVDKKKKPSPPPQACRVRSRSVRLGSALELKSAASARCLDDDGVKNHLLESGDEGAALGGLQACQARRSKQNVKPAAFAAAAAAALL